jgi:hypothetical protein
LMIASTFFMVFPPVCDWMASGDPAGCSPG